MIPQTLREHYLVDELQLGQTLNQAISQGRRSEFSLLLAMLSADVEDQPWVADPATHRDRYHRLASALRAAQGPPPGGRAY